MLLKCRYLSQFSMSEIGKAMSTSSPANHVFASAAARCPFMSHVRRSIHSTSSTTSTATPTAHESNPASESIILNQDIVSEKNQEMSEIKPMRNNKESVNMKKKSEMISESSKEFKYSRHHLKRQVCTNTINCPFFESTGLTEQSLSSLIRQVPLSNSNTNENKTTSRHGEKRTDHLFDYDRFFSARIEAKKRDGSYRQFKRVVREAATFPQVFEHQHSPNESTRPVTIWCSNDYLGLGAHPYVREQVCRAVQAYGAGSGGTRNISGSTPLHVCLEAELAKLHQQESALLFTSCYVANDTTLYTLARLLGGGNGKSKFTQHVVV